MPGPRPDAVGGRPATSRIGHQVRAVGAVLMLLGGAVGVTAAAGRLLRSR